MSLSTEVPAASAPADVRVHDEAGVRTLTLARLDKKNSITQAMYAALADALAAAAADEGTRVVVIQGHETVFSAGNDIGDFLARPPQPEAEPPVMRFLFGIARFPKPLVAAVCGPAVGIGTTMLLHCDLVVAGDNAAFSLPFVNLGLCPEAASSLLLPQLLGYQRAARALLLGEPFSAQTALEFGLVGQVLPPAEVAAAAQALARKLCERPLASLIETKRLMKQGATEAVLRQMQDEGKSFGRMLHEPAAREALQAFMERRRPDFSKL
jgi:enoyl-CoA hydratase/carnithine racemase